MLKSRSMRRRVFDGWVIFNPPPLFCPPPLSACHTAVCTAVRGNLEDKGPRPTFSTVCTRIDLIYEVWGCGHSKRPYNTPRDDAVTEIFIKLEKVVAGAADRYLKPQQSPAYSSHQLRSVRCEAIFHLQSIKIMVEIGNRCNGDREARLVTTLNKFSSRSGNQQDYRLHLCETSQPQVHVSTH